MLTDKEYWKQVIKEALKCKAEYNFLDFKLDLTDQNERLKEHVNAFGHLERGGCFIFGVKDFIPVGLQSSADDIIQRVTNIATKTQEPSLSVDAFPLTVGDIGLLCIHVLPGITKPVFIKDRAPLGGAACFRRTGSSTIAMSVHEIKALLVDAQENYYDESAVKGANSDELDFDKLLRLLPELDKNEKNCSKNIAMLADCRILTGMSNSPQITVAGWLCFGKNPQNNRQFRNACIEFQIFKGIARDTPLKKYEIKGDLPSQIEQSIQLLNQYIWLVPKITGTKREDVRAYPDIMLREVITNSLVHRDYRKMHQPIKIAMFDNRVEIENPGGLMPGLTTLNLIHKRDWRNPLLAELMKKFGFGEMDGQGIDRIYSLTLALKVPPPILADHQSSFIVVLSAPKTYEEFTAEEKRLMVIILGIMHKTIDNESLRNCFGISSDKASTLIKAMVAERILQTNSLSRKYAKYVFTERYREKIFS